MTSTWQKHFPLKSRNALCPLLLQQVKAVPRLSTSDSRVWWFRCKVSFWIHPGQRRNCLGMDRVLFNFINKKFRHHNYMISWFHIVAPGFALKTLTYFSLTISEKETWSLLPNPTLQLNSVVQSIIKGWVFAAAAASSRSPEIRFSLNLQPLSKLFPK